LCKKKNKKKNSMSSVSQNPQQNTSTKTSKKYRSSIEITRKIIAVEEIMQSNPNQSMRKTSEIFQLPPSTVRGWLKNNDDRKYEDEIDQFISSNSGQVFLNKIVLASMYNNKCGASGIRGVQEFLHNSGLDKYVASSTGALHNFWKRCEDSILFFGKKWKEILLEKMKAKTITLITDETFFKGKPCLVAIDALSNYILIETHKDDRKAQTWKEALENSIENHPVKVGQVVSDLCGALRSFTKTIGARHSPDIFHGQYELSKATSGALAFQERNAAKAYKESEEKLNKLCVQPVQNKEKIEEATQERDAKKQLYEEKQKIREEVQKSRKALGKIYHPIDLETGKIQSVKSIKKKTQQELNNTKEQAKKAELGPSPMKRINKGARAFEHMFVYLREYFIFFFLFIVQLNLTIQERLFFKEVIFPLCYFNVILKRLSKQEKEKVLKIKEKLMQSYFSSPFCLEFKEALMDRGKELAEQFQRSSSCVEGRNGVLSLMMHRFHRLTEKSLQVLTIVHNFGNKRETDGTTPAERYFGQKHGDLFEHLVKTVKIPRRPNAKAKMKKKHQAA
jgi:hypothetical protein